MCGRNFSASEIGDVLANLATTSRAMDKWMSQLDSAGRKCPETTLEGFLTGHTLKPGTTRSDPLNPISASNTLSRHSLST